jgi:hypothetical protein
MGLRSIQTQWWESRIDRGQIAKVGQVLDLLLRECGDIRADRHTVPVTLPHATLDINAPYTFFQFLGFCGARQVDLMAIYQVSHLSSAQRDPFGLS